MVEIWSISSDYKGSLKDNFHIGTRTNTAARIFGAHQFQCQPLLDFSHASNQLTMLLTESSDLVT